jgi:bifunctional DNA-binding transcriptional regulator/antitoxin component of YhaV-PrlF toxin-antitoxin module
MQTETLEKTTAEIVPYNEVAELIDREVHAKTLEQINVLAREYEIRNPSKVAEFLSENLFLLDLLKEIPAQIREVFGDEQNLKLEFFLDPEDANYHRLAVGVPTKKKLEKSSSLLQKFDENWWFANERKSRSKILIDLESAK